VPGFMRLSQLTHHARAQACYITVLALKKGA